MPGALPYQTQCCSPCDDPNVQNVPGATGDPGADGSDGSDGVNAYTTVTTQFLMPDGTGGTPTVAVVLGNTDWMSVGQMVYVQVAGYMEVTAIADSNNCTLKNVEDGSGVYDDNAAPSTPISVGNKVVAGGWQGPSTAASGSAGGDLDGTYPDPDLAITTTLGDIIVNQNGVAADRNTKLSKGAQGTVLHTHSGETLGVNYRSIDLTGTDSSLTGALPIAKGGTGSTVAADAFDALAPTGTKGDVVANNGTANVAVAVGASGDGKVLMADSAVSAGVKYAFLEPENFGPDAEEVVVETVILRETQSSGTAGTSLTGGSGWKARVLNEVSCDTTGVVTTAAHTLGGMTGNKFSLPQGHYRIRADAVVSGSAGKHQIRLSNISDGGVQPYWGTTDKVIGLSVRGTTNMVSVSSLEGRFVVDGVSGEDLAVEHYIQTATGNFGEAISTGDVEVYMTVRIEKLAKQVV